MTWHDIHRFDQDLTLTVNSWHTDFTDPIWEFFSDIPVWIPMYALIIAFIIWRLGWKKGLMVVAGALLTFGFCDQSLYSILYDVGELVAESEGKKCTGYDH